MSGSSSFWLFGIRHALVALAVLATLVSAFGMHLHPDGSHEHGDPICLSAHGHACESDRTAVGFLGEAAAADDLDTDLDHGGCCHCHASTVGLPEVAGKLTSVDLIVKLLTPREELLRDGITYQPDPPPVLG